MYRMDILERALTYDEVTELFVGMNSLGAKLRSSDLALAQITAPDASPCDLRSPEGVERPLRGWRRGI